MDFMDYLDYFLACLHYLPYILYAFVFLTLIPKSLKKISAYAKEDYEKNRRKYHRCYGPELCCHISEQEWSEVVLRKKSEKPRKAVRRGFVKPHLPDLSGNNNEDFSDHIKRQVEASSIQTQTNVNQIARMFETGGGSSQSNASSVQTSPRKINRVQPNIQIPEIRMQTDEVEQKVQAVWNAISNKKVSQNNSNNNNGNLLNNQKENAKAITSKLNQLLEQENLQNSSSEAFNRDEPRVFHSDGSTSSTASPGASSSSPVSTPPLSPSRNSLRPSSPNSLICIPNSSMEDLFAAIAKSAEQTENFIYAGCKSLSPVTCIEDILSQRRLSRPLSAYSISDLLNEEPPSVSNETFC